METKKATGAKAAKARARKTPARPASGGGERSFLFRGCSAHAADGALTVSSASPLSVRLGSGTATGLVRWSTPVAVAGPIEVECAAGAPSLFDRRASRKRRAAKDGLSITFRGALRYSRLLLDDGPALLVQGSVLRITGLPGAAHPFDTASFSPQPAPDSLKPAGVRGGVDPSGPHQPWP
jgi:hypothetical protein